MIGYGPTGEDEVAVVARLRVPVTAPDSVLPLFRTGKMLVLPETVSLLIKPVMIYVLVTSLVGGMQMFDVPMLLTDGRGSPSNSILTNNILMNMRFRSSQGLIGAASAVGVFVFLMTSFVAVFIFYFLREKKDEKPAQGL